MKSIAVQVSPLADTLRSPEHPVALPAGRLDFEAPHGDHDWSAFELFEAGDDCRGDIEALIRHNYARNFGARVDAFMPHLFGLRAADGSLCGACGLRTASRKLFLEQYLQAPIEAAISARSGAPVARAGIVEIGHFSGVVPGASRAMIYLLTQYLRSENFTWVSFTGTRALRNAFRRMGLALLDIAAADCTRLPLAARANWGTYYQHEPHVMAGEISSGFASLMHTTTECDA